MSAPVFQHTDLPDVTVGDVVVITGPEAHHALAVQRLRAGEPIEVVNGSGTRIYGVVDSASSRDLHVRVIECVEEPEASPRIVVVQAIPKGDRGERAVELLTEVGVDVVIPWQAQNCVTRWSGERGEKAYAKWDSTARESAKQSRRSWSLVVEQPSITAEVCDRVRAAQERGATVWLLHESTELQDPGIPDADEVWLIVGPEGGVSQSEVRALTQAGATPVRLGSTVFRTSSAGAVAAAVVSTLTGRWTNARARMT